METGTVDTTALPGGLDLAATLESGQTYQWRRSDGGTYDAPVASDAWYETVLSARRTASNQPEVLRVRHRNGTLEWESSSPDAPDHLRRLLRLEDDLPAIRQATPADPLLERAYDAHRGMRLVADDPFACLISFICSAQMRVERIYRMQTALADAYGTPVELDGRTYHAFPTPDQLAAATESALRELGLGYRAPYVRETAAMVADGTDPAAARGREYESAREWLTQFVGVGEKVADCVLLFSLGYLEAVPLDTWIRQAIAEYYPDCDRGNYEATSRAIRERFGGRYAGYAQTYAFHHLRTGGD